MSVLFWIVAALFVGAALGLAAWWGFEATRGRGLVPQLLVALATSVLYTGMLMTSYFLIEYGATL